MIWCQELERQYITRAEVLHALQEEKARTLWQSMTGAEFDQQEERVMSPDMLIGAIVFVEKLKWTTGESISA